ncbi:MAG: 4-hydroxythreonine-4-phosphate dehydrogenase PdxA, partial [Pseudomonadota bacterium]
MGHPLPVAVTCGDPSGIGPEIIAKAWSALDGAVPFFVIADPRHLPVDVPVAVIDDPSILPTGALPVLRHSFAGSAQPGNPNPANAAAVVTAIERGTQLVLGGEASALCTAPISKKELVDHAGFFHPGHTEFLAALSGADLPVMMLASETLKVVPATIHIPLKDVPEALTSERLEATIRITHAAMIRDFGFETPRISVAGLNPHAGEGGLLGAEDDAIIAPVCERLRHEGMRLSGPLPADTMFHAAARA